MRSAKMKVVNPLGLHARAAAVLVRRAGTFCSDIKIRRTDNQVVADAKSILSILTLAASKGIEVEIEVSGADEGEAFRAMEEIFVKGFGEI
jgi:phosphocarrier protein